MWSFDVIEIIQKLLINWQSDIGFKWPSSVPYTIIIKKPKPRGRKSQNENNYQDFEVISVSCAVAGSHHHYD